MRYRPVRRGAGRGVAGTPHRGAFEQFVEHVSLCLVEPVDEVGDLFAGARAVFEGHLTRVPRQRRAGVGGDPHRSLARRLPPAAAIIANAVLLPIRVVGMSRTEHVRDIRVVTALLVPVADQQRDRGARSVSLEHTR